MLLLAIGIAVAAGALRTAQPKAHAAGRDDQVDTALYSVTVLDTETSTEVEDQYWEAEPGERLLLVTVRIENLAAYPVMVLGAINSASSRLIQGDESLLRLGGIRAVDAPRVWRADGSLRGPILQPGVPAEVVIGWPVDAAQLRASDISLDVYDAKEVRGRFVVSANTVTWSATDLVARVDLEIQP